VSLSAAASRADLRDIEWLTDREGQGRGDQLGIKLYEDWRDAQRTVLRRKTMAELTEVPGTVQAGIRRVFGRDLTPRDAVEQILADVRQRGDQALREWTSRIDRVELGDLEVPENALREAYEAIPEELAGALRLAADRIREFHASQPVASWSTSDMGGTLGQRVTPLARVGVYVPGGTAPLPSSLLMAVIPARVAGVDEVIVCTPPGREDGRVSPVVLAAAHVAGVDRVFRLGGAQAIAALAFGTESRRLRPSPLARRVYPASTRSPAPEVCSLRWRSASSTERWVWTACMGRRRLLSLLTKGPIRPGSRLICWRRPNMTCWPLQSC